MAPLAMDAIGRYLVFDPNGPVRAYACFDLSLIRGHLIPWQDGARLVREALDAGQRVVIAWLVHEDRCPKKPALVGESIETT